MIVESSDTNASLQFLAESHNKELLSDITHPCVPHRNKVF